MNSNDAAVEEDSSDKDRIEHVNNTTKMRKISATAEVCQKAKTDAKQIKKNKM